MKVGRRYHNHNRDSAGTTNVMQVAGLITSVKTIGERAAWARTRLNLTQEQVADMAGVTQGMIGNLEGGVRKNPRELLRIAAALRVRPEWLQHGVGPIEASDVGQEDMTSLAYNKGNVVTSWRLIPLILWDRLDSMTKANDDLSIADLPLVPADPRVGPRTKAVQMLDDSMAPRIRPGDVLLFDPDMAALPGKVVLVVAPDGQHYVRMYRVRHGGRWEAVAESAGYDSLDSETDQLTVVATAVGRWQSDF
jgi:transcriptional regulator with XRE-family HTH domain